MSDDFYATCPKCGNYLTREEITALGDCVYYCQTCQTDFELVEVKPDDDK